MMKREKRKFLKKIEKGWMCWDIKKEQSYLKTNPTNC
jgi:hypothetical protein